MQVINTKNLRNLKYSNRLFHFKKPFSVNFEKIDSSTLEIFCITNMENKDLIILNSDLFYLQEDFSKRKIVSEQILLNGNWYYQPNIHS